MKDRARQRFGTEELAVVLSRYDLGAIESITTFDRGSRRSPKVGIVAQRGKYLLKRRASERRSKRRVTLGHAVQRALAARDFPIARLVCARDDGDTCTRIGDEIYELFEFVSGHAYGRTTPQTVDAGHVLARFHDTLRSFKVPANAPVGSYHDVNGVRTALQAIPKAISSHDSVSGQEAELLGVVQRLFDDYDNAADAVNALDFPSLPLQIVHADWHPGNMLFKRDEIVAVIDYDSCRLSRRVADVANGLLQFSITGRGDPDGWPDEPDEQRFKAFVDGYQEISNLSEAETLCISHLMIEALISESVFPIAHDGSFGRWTGFGFLCMIARKVKWLRDHELDLRQFVQNSHRRAP